MEQLVCAPETPQKVAWVLTGVPQGSVCKPKNAMGGRQADGGMKSARDAAFGTLTCHRDTDIGLMSQPLGQPSVYPLVTASRQMC